MEQRATTEVAGKRLGRPRDESARQRILDAAVHLLQEVGFASTTIEAIAERAGVGKATVYRWWPNKAAVMIEAFREEANREAPFPSGGSLEDDIRLQMKNFTRMLTGYRGRTLAAIVAAAQSDAEVEAAMWTYWLQPRRADAKAVLEAKKRQGQLCEDVNTDLLVDSLYGPLYLRLMMHLPFSEAYTNTLVDFVLQALPKR